VVDVEIEGSDGQEDFGETLTGLAVGQGADALFPVLGLLPLMLQRRAVDPSDNAR
jgi:hypothetical protein